MHSTRSSCADTICGVPTVLTIENQLETCPSRPNSTDTTGELPDTSAPRHIDTRHRQQVVDKRPHRLIQQPTHRFAVNPLKQAGGNGLPIRDKRPRLRGSNISRSKLRGFGYRDRSTNCPKNFGAASLVISTFQCLSFTNAGYGSCCFSMRSSAHCTTRISAASHAGSAYIGASPATNSEQRRVATTCQRPWPQANFRLEVPAPDSGEAPVTRS